MICSGSYGGGISEAPTAVLGGSEESSAAAAGLCPAQFCLTISIDVTYLPYIEFWLHRMLLS